MTATGSSEWLSCMTCGSGQARGSDQARGWGQARVGKGCVTADSGGWMEGSGGCGRTVVTSVISMSGQLVRPTKAVRSSGVVTSGRQSCVPRRQTSAPRASP